MHRKERNGPWQELISDAELFLLVLWKFADYQGSQRLLPAAVQVKLNNALEDTSEIL